MTNKLNICTIQSITILKRKKRSHLSDNLIYLNRFTCTPLGTQSKSIWFIHAYVYESGIIKSYLAIQIFEYKKKNYTYILLIYTHMHVYSICSYGPPNWWVRMKKKVWIISILLKIMFTFKKFMQNEKKNQSISIFMLNN